ncbi:rhr-2, partial [Pristionchus pacificus]
QMTREGKWQRRQFPFWLCIFQIIFILCFSLCAHFNEHALPDNKSKVYVNTDYPLFQDIHVMSLVGFGFLMAFLKRYGFAAVSMNLLLCAFVSQWAMLIRGFLSQEFRDSYSFTISIEEIMIADLSCTPILISMGALIGRFTPMQFLFMAFIETLVCTGVEYVVITMMHVNDGGRSLVIHAFGAYFGLAVAKTARKVRVLSKRGTIRVVGEDAFDDNNSETDGVDHSELFSMIGTLFLWIFFPSFNAAVQEPEDARIRAVINTYLSMTSCTVITFMLTSLTDRQGRFNMIHIQSSTLAGGVAIGSVANAILQPWHSLLIGGIAAIISVFGHTHIQPYLRKSWLSVTDTCGVHNLHGLPGILSGLCSIVIVVVYNPSYYGDSLYQIYPYFVGGDKNGNRGPWDQAAYQFYAIVIVFFGAVISGAITGCLLRAGCVNQMSDPTGAHGQEADRAGFYYGLPQDVMWKSMELQREMQMRYRDHESNEIY